MATFDEIKEVRLRIGDPFGFINFLEVADAASLPASPVNQTGYKTTDTGYYYSTEKTSPSVPGDYNIEDLQVSDARISAWIDAYGIDSAACRALSQIIAQLGKELGGFKRNRSGAEEVEYNSIKDMYDYYKSILDLCKENERSESNTSTGKIGKMKVPEIAGGNL